MTKITLIIGWIFWIITAFSLIMATTIAENQGYWDIVILGAILSCMMFCTRIILLKLDSIRRQQF